jgi:hypothetical protein
MHTRARVRLMIARGMCGEDCGSIDRATLAMKNEAAVNCKRRHGTELQESAPLKLISRVVSEEINIRASVSDT